MSLLQFAGVDGNLLRSVAELGPSYIAKKLLLPNADEAENALPREFLEEFINRFNEDGLDEVCVVVHVSSCPYVLLRLTRGPPDTWIYCHEYISEYAGTEPAQGLSYPIPSECS